MVCRQLDRIRQGDDVGGGRGQLCLFIGGDGGTGKSRVIEALVELLAWRDLSSHGEGLVDGRSRRDWQEKEVLVIDKVSILGAQTLHTANKQLCRLRGSHVALELRGARTTTVAGDAVAVRPVQPVRERDPVGNRVPEEMTAAQARLEELSRQTTREAADWLSG
ncbi:hypothetical protein HRG_002612 [Hirsutella rhossiliensis]|uniref:Uncharacterized protein n=1 Tax=Hirsutella rhossiliensis TaxID=111463 RepID=A0A9P8SL84_9HYPO|nr:uncharacterized protein HRG_02612 [Hirsutella rhossiliensis]KAH0967203.1 hypothetical protein HRG_02612 [Hirsutella rhossiliensis]